MKQVKYILTVGMAALLLFLSEGTLRAAEDIPQLPRFFLNGKPVTLTVQDLSGLGTRPLRLLVQRNNRKHKDELIQVYALGGSEGDDLRIEPAAPLPGMRVTLYKILHEKDGSRYLSMPTSVYFNEPGETLYQEEIGEFREAFFIVIFEKTDSSEKKDINIRYFEERVRKLSIESYKTNLLLSSLKLKMRDISISETEAFFERDVQLLVDRLIDPRRIFLIRIWKAAGKPT